MGNRVNNLATENYQTILLDEKFPILTVTLNRPKVANAMNLLMVNELMQVTKLIEKKSYRVLVIKGAGENFCAGGDIKDMQLVSGDNKALTELNRAFGNLLQKVNKLPAVVICLLQGVVLGGGFGLACVSDVAIAQKSCKFALPETSLGIIPAQIAPFVLLRIGLTATRRMALLGLEIDCDQALQLGVVHQIAIDETTLMCQLDKTIEQVLRCAPRANQKTKALLHAVSERPMNELLDQAAIDFACAAVDEGKEGAMAFIQKRKPGWSEVIEQPL